MTTEKYHRCHNCEGKGCNYCGYIGIINEKDFDCDESPLEREGL